MYNIKEGSTGGGGGAAAGARGSRHPPPPPTLGYNTQRCLRVHHWLYSVTVYVYWLKPHNNDNSRPPNLALLPPNPEYAVSDNILSSSRCRKDIACIKMSHTKLLPKQTKRGLQCNTTALPRSGGGGGGGVIKGAISRTYN